jgi:hypothetical protein
MQEGVSGLPDQRPDRRAEALKEGAEARFDVGCVLHAVYIARPGEKF